MSQSEQESRGNFLRRVANTIRSLASRFVNALKSFFARDNVQDDKHETSEVMSSPHDVPLQEALVTIRNEVQNLVASPENTNVITAEATATDQKTSSKPRPLRSPSLPKEHRLLIKKCVRGGNRRLAEQKLEELGYLFPEVHTRGAYIVVNYRGVDGYLYTARFRYK
jgi:hypothetical protein